MPELPEVETVRRGLVPKLVGRRIVRLIQRRRDLRVPLPAKFAKRVEGRTVYLKVAAHDERELIGEGTHERVVVNLERFDRRVQEKARS